MLMEVMTAAISRRAVVASAPRVVGWLCGGLSRRSVSAAAHAARLLLREGA
jgi:hypothetical protein